MFNRYNITREQDPELRPPKAWQLATRISSRSATTVSASFASLP